MTEIPAEIMSAILKSAAEEWPDDKDMQEHTIEEESSGYREFSSADFAAALTVKDDIIREAMESHDTWEARANHVHDEIQAYTALEELAPEDIPMTIVAAVKHKAAAEHDWYRLQFQQVECELATYRQIVRTRTKVAPIRELLQRMEQIIGSSCYNANIQNRSWGYLESSGRQFRYPVTFYTSDTSNEKRWDRQDDLSPEALITGHYKVGANELNIYRALVKIVDMLREDYGLQLPH
ncbi:hypothetical protein [Novosphingobium nitrogenifigens]|nr:hypothetical protein [Novosphingobium nitrogenifigens]